MRVQPSRAGLGPVQCVCVCVYMVRLFLEEKFQFNVKKCFFYPGRVGVPREE